jgi:hypothetical protein
MNETEKAAPASKPDWTKAAPSDAGKSAAVPHWKAGLKPEVVTGTKQAAIPRQYEPRLESDKELRAFLNERQFLEKIPVSRRTLFTWVQSGKIPCVKIGRRKLFHWPSCEAALLRMQRGGGQ